MEVAPRNFDCIVSWLVFLHIPAKAELYKKCAESLKPGGRIYVEGEFPIFWLFKIYSKISTNGPNSRKTKMDYLEQKFTPVTCPR